MPGSGFVIGIIDQASGFRIEILDFGILEIFGFGLLDWNLEFKL